MALETFFQDIKNAFGDIRGYARCCVTGDTLWHTDTYSVPISNGYSIAISARALEQYPPEKIAAAVYESSKEQIKGYSLERITQAVLAKEWIYQSRKQHK